MVMTYCGDYFSIYTDSDSLCCTPEINVMSYVSYISVKNKIKWSELLGGGRHAPGDRTAQTPGARKSPRRHEAAHSSLKYPLLGASPPLQRTDVPFCLIET